MTGAERAADVDLDAIEQRANAATYTARIGEWRWFATATAQGQIYRVIDEEGFIADVGAARDAEFISRAGVDVPALVAAVRAERARADEAEEERDSALAELARVREAVETLAAGWMATAEKVRERIPESLTALAFVEAASRVRAALSDAGQPQAGDSE